MVFSFYQGFLQWGSHCVGYKNGLKSHRHASIQVWICSSEVILTSLLKSQTILAFLFWNDYRLPWSGKNNTWGSLNTSLSFCLWSQLIDQQCNIKTRKLTSVQWCELGATAIFRIHLFLHAFYVRVYHSKQFHPTHTHITTPAIKIQNCSIITEELSHATPLLSHLLHPCPLATTNLFSISIVLSFYGCCVNGITQRITLWNDRCSWSLMPSDHAYFLSIHGSTLFISK